MNSADERIDFFGRVIKRKRGARCCRNPEALHHRLRTVMAGADRDTVVIEDRSDVVRVYAVEHEGKYARFSPRGPDDAQAVDSRESCGGILQQITFMGHRSLKIDTVQIVDRGTESDTPRYVRRPRLKLMREVVVGGFFEGDGLDHVSAPLVRRDLFE